LIPTTFACWSIRATICLSGCTYLLHLIKIKIDHPALDVEVDATPIPEAGAVGL